MKDVTASECLAMVLGPASDYSDYTGDLRAALKKQNNVTLGFCYAKMSSVQQDKVAVAYEANEDDDPLHTQARDKVIDNLLDTCFLCGRNTLMHLVREELESRAEKESEVEDLPSDTE